MEGLLSLAVLSILPVGCTSGHAKVHDMGWGHAQRSAGPISPLVFPSVALLQRCSREPDLRHCSRQHITTARVGKTVRPVLLKRTLRPINSHVASPTRALFLRFPARRFKFSFLPCPSGAFEASTPELNLTVFLSSEKFRAARSLVS